MAVPSGEITAGPPASSVNTKRTSAGGLIAAVIIFGVEDALRT